jgi:hypothetical protein
MTAIGVELKEVRLELTREPHKRFRIGKARQDMSMEALVRSLVEGHLAKREGSAK